MMKVFAYKSCDSCRKAVKWLNENGVEFELLAVRETPPSVDDLRYAASVVTGGMKKLFNTAGKDYRELGLKDKLPSMTDDEAFAWLSANGNLVKRPLVIDRDRGVVFAGFRPADWSAALV